MTTETRKGRVFTPREVWLVDTVAMMLRHNAPINTEGLLKMLELRPEWQEQWAPTHLSRAYALDTVKWAARTAGGEEMWVI